MLYGVATIYKTKTMQKDNQHELDKKIHCKYNIIMNKIRFEWDASKARSNEQKHKVSFMEAKTVFYDECAVEFYDDAHSEWEDRFLLLGVSSERHLLLVCHCYREEGGTIRIISARRATKNEEKHYPIGGRR